MATIATDPAFAPHPTQIGGSYEDNTGAVRNLTLNFVYPENGNSEEKQPLTKREYFALMLLTGKTGSPTYESISAEVLAYQSVNEADMLIATLNNVPIP